MHTAIEKLDNSITDFGLVDAFLRDVKGARQRYYASMHMGDRATDAMRWHGGPAMMGLFESPRLLLSRGANLLC
ncbi:hypothetical protein B7755_044210 [Streptomyces sp. NBS 14/10]|uniref:hypothetical protein n=1 Tax=Streptomyces sp. NBS 14/10 TaxID=1945643 RepID=UPI000B7FB8F7|nr:hypothetical protein [Streptomyces sp. NBS 14/10]KAK1184487.1 hypothetical protein B7755_044210 [Streptomyces sp. NBS 14/10]